MGALSFKEEFVPKVLKGLKGKKGGKRQSIRNLRKRPLKVGEKLYLYFGMRTKWCKKLGESVVMSRQVLRISAERITIYDELNPKEIDNGLQPRLKFNRVISNKLALDRFARNDGFDTWETMKRWWILTHGSDCFPYTGHLYKW